MRMTGPTDKVGTDRGDQFERRREVGGEAHLGGDPGFGTVGRKINDAALARSSDDDPAIDEVEQHSDATHERGLRPVIRGRKVVLQVQTGIANGLFDESIEVLVIPMASVMGQAAGPLSREVTDG